MGASVSVGGTTAPGQMMVPPAVMDGCGHGAHYVITYLVTNYTETLKVCRSCLLTRPHWARGIERAVDFATGEVVTDRLRRELAA